MKDLKVMPIYKRESIPMEVETTLSKEEKKRLKKRKKRIKKTKKKLIRFLSKTAEFLVYAYMAMIFAFGIVALLFIQEEQPMLKWSFLLLVPIVIRTIWKADKISNNEYYGDNTTYESKH